MAPSADRRHIDATPDAAGIDAGGVVVSASTAPDALCATLRHVAPAPGTSTGIDATGAPQRR